jgi:Ca2+-binding RTX toxin-like protein
MFENLESRRMYSVATPTVDVTTGVLKITGDSASDNVQVSKLNATQIVVNDLTTAASFTFNASQVTKITFDGNEGDDRFEVIQGTGTRRLNLPVEATGGVGNDTLISTGGDDKLDGGAGNDELTSGDGKDTLVGGAGKDVLDAGAGDDKMDGGANADRMDGGDGVDTVDYSSRTNRVTVDLRPPPQVFIPTNGERFESDSIFNSENAIGGSGSDILIGSSVANNLKGGAGNDKIKGLGGDDRLTGNAGNDSMFGGAGADTMNGNDGADLVSGEAGADNMDGGADSDILIGGTESDAMFGGSGDDFIFAQDGARDSVAGGAGNDQAEMDSVDQPIQDTIEELLS